MTVDGTVADTGGDVRCSGIEGSDDARAAVLPEKPGSSKSALFLWMLEEDKEIGW